MAKRGRPVKGAELVRLVDGSPPARERLEVLLQTLSGAITIPQACAMLGISRSRFHSLRGQFLQQATGLLEPRPRGPRPDVPGPAELELRRLQQQVVQLKIDLKAAHIREEIALVMPHLLKRGDGAGKKTTRRPRKTAQSVRPVRSKDGIRKGSAGSRR
jgi:hypothetical protein